MTLDLKEIERLFYESTAEIPGLNTARAISLKNFENVIRLMTERSYNEGQLTAFNEAEIEFDKVFKT